MVPRMGDEELERAGHRWPLGGCLRRKEWVTRDKMGQGGAGGWGVLRGAWPRVDGWGRRAVIVPEVGAFPEARGGSE